MTQQKPSGIKVKKVVAGDYIIKHNEKVVAVVFRSGQNPVRWTMRQFNHRSTCHTTKKDAIDTIKARFEEFAKAWG